MLLFSSHTRIPPSCHPLPPVTTPPLPLATTNLFFVSLILSFQESYINGITQGITFWGWIFFGFVLVSA